MNLEIRDNITGTNFVAYVEVPDTRQAHTRLSILKFLCKNRDAIKLVSGTLPDVIADDVQMYARVYKAPQDTWNLAKCRAVSRQGATDAFGTKQRPGCISPDGCMHTRIGKVQPFARSVAGVFYKLISTPLPEIHKDYRLKYVDSWGVYIEKK